MKILLFNNLNIILSVGIALVTCFSTTSYGAQTLGDHEFTLSGSGVSSEGFDTTTFSVDAGLGWFTTKEFEWGIRQNVGFADTEDKTTFNGATRLFADYHLDYRVWQPFLGASLGGQYGSGVKDAFIIGPEIGVKYYVMPKTFILGRVAYLFDVEEDIDDGSTFYTVGIGYNF